MQRIPVIVPPNGLSQNMELWDGKLCVRRCTGVAMQAPFVGPCLCGADRDIKNRACKPHTRLGVFLKQIPSLGLWRLDSKGGNAAAELPNAAEFLAHARTYVDAWLYVAERTGSFLDPKDNVVKAATYMVPGLTIEGIGFDELMSGEVARRAELGRGGGGHRAIEAVQARFRAQTDPRVVDDLADAAFDVIHGLANVRLSTGVLVLLSRRTLVAPLGRDSSGRWERADSFDLMVHRPSPHRDL